MISLATYGRILTIIGTAFFCVVPSLLALLFALSVVEVIRWHDPITANLAVNMILMCCVAFPFLVTMGREFAGLRCMEVLGKRSKAETL